MTQPPKQGKAALESLQALVLSPYFPTEIPDAVARLKGSELQSARAPLIMGFVDLICFGWPDSNSPLHTKAAALVALLAIVELHRKEALPRLILNVNKLLMHTEEWPVELGCSLAIRLAEVGEKVYEPGRPIVRKWLVAPSKGAKRARVVQKALFIGWLRDDAEAAILQLKAEDFGDVIDQIPPEMATAAAKLYSSAKTWDEANNYASRFAIKYASWFSERDLDLIFAEVAAGRNDLPGSHGYREFLAALAAQDESKCAGVAALLESHGLEGVNIKQEPIENARSALT
ncbi:hypothetical protein [Hoeflea sp. IMCC20628]|uniref:hypothetical protein n=1 Tax=Hoeflea sp. IMCC20628 TaxID=1620421 RepID=UPI0012E0B982|nr:hypothetical protein [Hoeflea sp. IMCC20628]